MKAKARSASRSVSFWALPLAALGSILFATACGTSAGSQNSQGQTFQGNTNVTVLVTSTANAQLTEFGLNFNSITLTTKAGQAATLLSNPQTGQWAEFIHLNGTIEPLATASIPQGIYTSATANIGYSEFTCVTLLPATDPNDPGGLLTATFAYGYTPSSHVSISLPSPITVTGNSMGLVFHMAVVQSASLGSCYSPAGTVANYSITPTFTVTPATSAAETGLDGEITSVNAVTNSMTMTLADGQSVTANTNNSTAYRGIADFSGLVPGMLVTVDANFQSDGTQVAQRIEVSDTNASTISDVIGPVLQTNPSGPTGIGPSAFVFGPQSQGYLDVVGPMNESFFEINQSNFQISGALSNLSSLPFVPVFDSSDLVPGENVKLTTEATVMMGPGYPAATTMTLVPQVINATVTSISNSGSFQDFTAFLAPYDVFPTFAIQAGQTTLLNNPSQVEVYVDSNTQQFNTQALSPGGTFRFYGLVFNDNGTLRMDCAQVNDGVTATLPTSAAADAATGQNRVVHRSGPGRVQQTIITNTSR